MTTDPERIVRPYGIRLPQYDGFWHERDHHPACSYDHDRLDAACQCDLLVEIDQLRAVVESLGR